MADKECRPAGNRSNGQSLGEFLTNTRLHHQLSLREVEEAAQGQVSNAYLSQLEHGRIAKPSPNILYCLARVYNIPYELLMEKAGYVAGSLTDQGGSQRHGRLATFVDKKLTKDE